MLALVKLKYQCVEHLRTQFGRGKVQHQRHRLRPTAEHVIDLAADEIHAARWRLAHVNDEEKHALRAVRALACVWTAAQAVAAARAIARFAAGVAW